MNNSEDWFEWFYESWKNYCPGDLIENGLKSSSVAERFIEENQIRLLEIAKDFNYNSYEDLKVFMTLSESELQVLKYFLRLVKLHNKSK